MQKPWTYTREQAIQQIVDGNERYPFDVAYICYSAKKGGYQVCDWAAGDNSTKFYNGKPV